MFDWLETILKKIRKMDGSIDKYKKDTVIQSLPSLAYVNRAKKLIEGGYLKEAENVLNSALNLPQEDALVYKYLGIVAEKTGRKSDAIVAYKKAAKINPHDKDIWRQLGFVLVSVNFAEEAAECFENANKITPLNTDVYTGWGMSLLKLKKLNEAHEKFVQASKIDKYNFMAMLLSAIVEIKTGQYDDAEMKLKFLASVSPNESNTYEYAHLKYLKEDFEGAIHYAKKALTYNSMMLPAYVLLGEIYYKLKDEKNSLAAYNQAFQKELINEELYREWGTALQVFEKYDEAQEKFQKVLSVSPDRMEAKAGMALCLAFRGEVDGAFEILNSLSEEDKKHYLSQKAFGFAEYHSGNYSNAVDCFKNVLKTESYDSKLLYYIAKSYQALDNEVLAKEYFEKSARENPSHIPTYLDYADFLISKGEYADCQRKLRKILRGNENNIEILNKLFYVGYILVKENVCEYNVKETLAIADKIVSINSDDFKYPNEKNELSDMLNKL